MRYSLLIRFEKAGEYTFKNINFSAASLPAAKALSDLMLKSSGYDGALLIESRKGGVIGWNW